MEFDTLLREEIVSELEKLDDIEIGSDCYKVTVDGLVKLMDRAIEIDKMNIGKEEQEAKRKDAKAATEFENKIKREQLENTKAIAKFDNLFKSRQMTDEQIDRIVRNCIAAAGIIVPSVITVWGALMSFKFEEEGTITTSVGRAFMSRLYPKK